MSDNQLPPFDKDDTSENRAYDERTAPIDSQRTRPATPINMPTEPARQRATRAQPPVGTGHVQPPTGTQPVVRPPQQRRTGYGPRPPKPNRAEDSSLYLPWWSLVIMLVGVLVIALSLVGIIYVLGNPQTFAQPTPIIRIITAQPTSIPAQSLNPTSAAPSTEVIAGGNSAGELVLDGPTLAPVIFTPTPVSVRVGSTIIVEGVQDNSLNVRDRAGLNGTTRLFLAEEGEIFTVVDGPAQADGFTWWRIQDPDDPNRTGWAVSNFLEGIANQ